MSGLGTGDFNGLWNEKKNLFHTVIISFLFKFIAIHNLSNIKCLLLPTLSQRRSMKNLIPGVIGGIFNDIWVPESLWGQRRLEKSPMLWNPVLHFLNLIIGETVIKPGLVKVFALLAIKTDELFPLLFLSDTCADVSIFWDGRVVVLLNALKGFW